MSNGADLSGTGQLGTEHPVGVAVRIFASDSGALTLGVVCKAGFALEPGRSTLLDEIVSPTPDDRYSKQGSLLAATDLCPPKARADVVLTGSAFVSEGVKEIVARLTIGRPGEGIDKALRVTSERRLSRGEMVGGGTFTRATLEFERAPRNPDNPVGVALNASGSTEVHLPRQGLLVSLPHGELVMQPVSAGGFPSFGPIAPNWPARWRYLVSQAAQQWALAGGFAARSAPWFDGRAYKLPAGIDPAFFNVAPPDQQLSRIRGDEPILLEHLSPEFDRLETHLPLVVPRVVVTLRSRGAQEIELLCDTLAIDTDRSTAALVWRGFVTIDTLSDVVSVRGRLRAGPVSAPSSPKLESVRTPTRTPTQRIRMVPLAEAAPIAEQTLPTAEPETTEHVGPPADAEEQMSVTMDIPAEVLDRQTSEVPLTPAVAELPATMTTLPFKTPQPQEIMAALPFHRTAPREADLGIEPAPITPAVEDLPPLAPAPWPIAAPAMVAPPAPVMPGVGAGTIGQSLKQKPWTPPVAAPAVEEEEEPSPPTLLTKVAEPTAPAPPRELGLEEYAVIAAEIAFGKNDRASVLSERNLSDEQYEPLAKSLEASMSEELSRGRIALRTRFDKAFVARLEELRGAPLSAEDYAGLVVATERAQAAEALHSLGLPAQSQMSIERVWLERMTEEPGLKKEVRRAVETLREN